MKWSEFQQLDQLTEGQYYWFRLPNGCEFIGLVQDIMTDSGDALVTEYPYARELTPNDAIQFAGPIPLPEN